MGRFDAILQRLKKLELRAGMVRERAFPEDYGDGTDRIRSLEERAMVIRFMTEVYHQGQDEQVWAAKHPEDYRRILQIAGTVVERKEE